MEYLYEVAVVLHPDLEIDLDKPLAKIESILQKTGRIIAKDDWGKRKLAYPIKSQQFGLYSFYQVELAPEVIAEIERSLTINEEVLRHLIIRVPKIKLDSSKDSKDNKKEAEPSQEKPAKANNKVLEKKEG